MLTTRVCLFDVVLLRVLVSVRQVLDALVLPVPRDITTVGAKRPGYGRAGQLLKLEINSFELTVEENNITHYDVIDPDTLSSRRKLALFDILQDQQPNIFTPKIAYDGQKMAYATRLLDLGEANARKVYTCLDISRHNFPRTGGAGGNATRPPRVFNITLTKVDTINTEILRLFTSGKQSWDENVAKALMAYNIALRMKPNLNNPFRGRSFFIDQDRCPIGGGLEVWRGIFQSVRPAIERLIVNVDLANTIMYKEGPLIHLCNEFLGRPANLSPLYLAPGHAGFPDAYTLSRLKRFITHLRIVVPTTGQNRPRMILGLSTRGASGLQFTTRQNVTMSVAQYFQQVTGRPLRFPDVICVQVGGSAMIPLEMCTVLKGQFVRRDVVVPQEQVERVLEFATKKPKERLNAITTGVEKLQFETSDYITQFGMSISRQPLQIGARVIEPPNLKYSGQGRQANPRNGAWNMVDKKFYKASSITVWAVVIYQDHRRFNDSAINGMVKGFQEACANVGACSVQAHEPASKLDRCTCSYSLKQLKEVGKECAAQRGGLPNLMVVILPERANEIYTAVKHFGDCSVGIATQCLMAKKCGSGAKQQYWMNVMLKVNAKLGGINSIAESAAMSEINDPRNPAIVIGADVIHPGPGPLNDRPSFTAVVGSVDSNASYYLGTSRVQTGRQETISDLKDMCKHVLNLYHKYRMNQEKKSAEAAKPKRLIFYRDGVSEGEFKKSKIWELGMNPKITLIIVGKRHHTQMFPPHTGPPAESKNAPAGTVIDTEITHPTDFDFYLCSHAGILGTSRPAHYTVRRCPIADSLQSLSFALCHCYAPATRSVSIPAPVYYADRVCSRAKNHFSPNEPLGLSDAGTQASGQSQIGLEAYKEAYKPLHQNQRLLMYFSVCYELNYGAFLIANLLYSKQTRLQNV
ncbi:argonaute-like protein [Pholiota molesta]|nr:argonaute-like protein [Pholiota molesta]